MALCCVIGVSRARCVSKEVFSHPFIVQLLQPTSQTPHRTDASVSKTTVAARFLAANDDRHPSMTPNRHTSEHLSSMAERLSSDNHKRNFMDRGSGPQTSVGLGQTKGCCSDGWMDGAGNYESRNFIFLLRCRCSELGPLQHSPLFRRRRGCIMHAARPLTSSPAAAVPAMCMARIGEQRPRSES